MPSMHVIQIIPRPRRARQIPLVPRKLEPLAILVYNFNTVASGCTIDYVAPAHLGDTLIATAEEVALAGRTGVYDITVRNQKGDNIAHFRGKSYRIKGNVIQE